MVRNILYLLVCISMVLSCGMRQDQDEQPGKLLIVYTDWAESIAMTHLAQVLLERDLGYEVAVKLTDVEGVFNEISTSTADLFLDTWLPSTHSEYYDRYQNTIEDLGPNYKKARTGLVVPEYMLIKEIGQITDYYHQPIAGVDSAAGIMRYARQAIQDYGLANELLVLSDGDMAERLEEAIKRREDIVVTGWEPHWLFHRYDLKYLEDPQNIFMAQEQIHTIARKGFMDDNPAASIFFERMILTEDQMNSLLFEMNLQDDPLIGVKNWIEKNEFIVNQWTRGLGVDRQKIM